MKTTQLSDTQRDHLSEILQTAQCGHGRGLQFEPDALRAAAFVDWLEAATERGIMEAEHYSNAHDIAAEIAAGRAELAATIAGEQDIAKRILALAGGAGWGDGRRSVKLNGGGMAARAARYIVARRGNRPSQTSLEDAAAAAAAAIWFEWTCWQALFGEDAPFDNPVRHLCGVAWRAAFASLTRDSGEGRTGRKAGQGAQIGSEPLDAAQLQVEKVSLEAWATDRQGRIFDAGESQDERARRARRRVLTWLQSVLHVKPVGRWTSAERERVKSERRRFSVLARLIHGRDIASAAKGAGFDSGRAAIDSFRNGKVWARLRAAVAGHTGEAERKLMSIRKRAARRAAAAIRAQRRLSTGAGAFGVAGYSHSATKRVWRNGAGGGIGGRLASEENRQPDRRVLIGNPFAVDWLRATEERGASVAVAHDARALLIAARQERVAQFDNATRGLRAGWVRDC